MIGIALRERLTGAMVLRGEAHEEPIALDLSHTFRPPLRAPSWTLEGTLDALPFALGREVHGRGSFDEELRTLSYELELEGSEEARRLVLSREIVLENLYTSLTVLTGRILGDNDVTLARCLLRFDVRSEAGGLVRSLRMLTARGARRTFDGGGAAW